MKLKKNILICLMAWLALNSKAQTTDSLKPCLSIETRVTNYFQGGYELSVFWNTRSNFSFGIQAAGQKIDGNAKELVFESSNYDNIDIRISWLAAFKTRYHINKHHEGLYFEVSAGGESFRIESGNEIHNNGNGFVLPGTGYIWHPFGRKGFYINPNIGYSFVFSNQDERIINETTYKLKSSFVVPALSLGWKF